MRNFGQHHALMCGFRHARGKFIITLDDDLQHPPEEILRLIERMQLGDVDVVTGKYKEKQHNLFRNLGTWIIKQLSYWILEIPKTLDMTSFRIIRRDVVDAMLEFQLAKPRIGLIIFSITKNIANIETRHDVRREGKSGYSIRKLICNFLDNTLYYSSLPLRLTSALGALIAMASCALATYYLFLHLSNQTMVSGFTTLVLLILFFSGTILITLGVVGEYLIRIIRTSERRPTFVIREVLSD